MKYFDLVNENDEVIGSAPASECHSNPQLIHRVVHFTLVDGANEKILIAKRSAQVKFDSGMWCFMGEHLLKGDDYAEAAFRGMHNELGFDAKEGIGEKCNTIFRSPTQTEFARLYVGYYKTGALTPNPTEVSEAKWISLRELRANKQSYSAMTQYWVDHVNWDEVVRSTKEMTERATIHP